MVLLSAIAFKGEQTTVPERVAFIEERNCLIFILDNWAKTFMVERTMQRDFYLSNGVPVKVPMMHLESQMVYLEQDKYRVVAKPFRVRIYTKFLR